MSKITRLHPTLKNGLSTQEIIQQRDSGRVNIETVHMTKSTMDIIKDNVCTLFNLYNVLIAIALMLVGAYSNLLFIFIIIMNVSIGIAQELHSKKLVEQLSLLSAPKAEVIRNGKTEEINIHDVVLDDVILYASGKQVVVDAIIAEGIVEVNESLLTGEADLVTKGTGDLLLSGSFIASGSCVARVEHVGEDNYAAQIASEAKAHKKVESELSKAMTKTTKITSFLIIPLGILLFAEAYFLRSDVMKTAVVSTAAGLLGMLPKGLMLLISLALATGVIKLAKKNILVQELNSIETLAHVDMLCLDKTGTITEGKMSVQDIHYFNQQISHQAFQEMMAEFLGAVNDNNATFKALEDYFTKVDTQAEHVTAFSSERKWSGASFINRGSIIVGAPERIMTKPLPQSLQEQVIEGARILLVAHSPQVMDEHMLPHDLQPLAAIILVDPIRESAHQTLAFFKQEGVQIKIISGDNPQAVSGIAKHAGFADYDKYVDASTLQTDTELAAAAEKYNIFGRVTPQQKRSLMQHLKAKGHTVAMTGDGVNDVLALKEADCGIAMAEGSEAARQVAQIVLLDNDFSMLPEVVKEGRRVVNNVTNSASIFFIKTVYSVLLTLVCIILNIPFPFIPVQITLIDLAIEGYPAFFMSFEQNTEKIQHRFLPAVFKRAIPNACTILILILLMKVIETIFKLEPNIVVTIMYYLIGLVSISELVRISRPFNKLRTFLCVTVFVGFYVATILFHSLLHIEILSLPYWGLVIVLGILGLVIYKYLYQITGKMMQKKQIG